MIVRHFVSLVFLSYIIVTSHGAPPYKHVKEFTIGAVAPISKKCGSTEFDIRGIAITHAIHYALQKIGNSKYGFEVHDACSVGEVERRVAYKFAQEAYNNKKGPNVVLSSFTKESIKSIKLLSIEDIPMMAYAADNARLAQDPSITKEDVKLLASAYPEQSSKMKAVADLVNTLKFDHINVIASNDAQGKKGVALLEKGLNKAKISNKILVSDANNIDAAISQIAVNPLIKAVVLHLSGGLDAAVLEAAKKKGLEDLVVLSTHDWKTKGSELKALGKIAEGMLVVNTAESRTVQPNTKTSIYHGHLEDMRGPFTKQPWLEDYFLSLGANKKTQAGGCYSQVKPANVCTDALKKLKADLQKEIPLSVVIIDAVYAISEAAKKGANFFANIPTLDFVSPQTGNTIAYDDDNELMSTSFDIYSVGNDGQPANLGNWDKSGEPALKIEEEDLKFKDGSSQVPLSACSSPCPLGEHQTYPEGEDSGCWTCAPCPQGTVSNKSNSINCFQCQFGTTANPNGTQCVNYEIDYFSWFDPMGQFVIFLVVVGVVIVLFSIGIFAQNNSSKVVTIGGLNLCVFFLFGCLILFLSPIPLLMEPSDVTCTSFIGVFSIALTIPLACLISKTAIVSERYFDDDNVLTKTSLGKRPRALVIGICIILQIVIVALGNYFASPSIVHQDTDVWNVKYAECPYYKSFPFWISFGFNIGLGVFVNVLSCNADKIEERFSELKNIIVTSLFFYLMCLINVAIIYREINEGLAAAQSVMCFMFGSSFALNFILRKVYLILYKTKSDGTVEEEQLIESDPNAPKKVTAMRHSDGYKHHGIIQMRIEDDDEEPDA